MTVADAPRSAESKTELPVWRLVDLGWCEPLRAQAFAESVAVSVGAGEVPNTLVLARPAAPYVSLGFHQSSVEELDEAFLARRRVPVIRRVEGGGATWLDPDQWFYQLVYREEGGGTGGPADLARYLAAPARAARELGVAVDVRPPSDLVVGDRKISGNAGGDWADAHLVVGGILGRADHGAMTDMLRLPHPGLRGLLRAEVTRWVTSWEAVTGTLPNWSDLQRNLAEAFRALRLFRVRVGQPTPEEEARFQDETRPRHEDPAWRELPPVPQATGALCRRVRVAGPHGLLVFEEPSTDRLWVAIVDGPRVRAAFVLESSPAAAPHPLAPDTPEYTDLSDAVRAVPGFD